MVHLESRNIDCEHKRIEIGYKGKFACVKPCCFTIVSIRLLNTMQNSSPFLDANLGVLLDGEFYSVAGGKKKEWAIKVFALIADINFAVVGSATEQSQHR